MPHNEEPDEEEKGLMRDLMKKSDLTEIQRYRLERYNCSGRTDEIESDQQYLCALIDTEQRLRQVVQEEECIQQGLNGDEKKSQYETQSSETRLRDLAREYWVLEQKWWRSWREIKEARGYLTRGFELWRSHTQWYLHRVLREDCASRDGCCGRACGCCAKRATHAPYISTRKLGLGHCTVECACCSRSRGFWLSSSEKPRVSDTARVSGHYEGSRYASKIRDVSIWGILPGENGHPLDQINERPPAYIPKPVFPDTTFCLASLSI